MPQVKFEKKFGQSPSFIASTLMEDGGVPGGGTSASLLKEAIHVISCGYEDKSEWGKEVWRKLSRSSEMSICVHSFNIFISCTICR